MSRRLALAAVLVLSAAGIAACQSSQNAATSVQSATQAQMTPSLSTTDATFINKVGAGGIAEVELGRLAQSHGTRTDVRAFGAQMVSDHSAANQELTALAERKEMTPPAEMDLMDKQLYDRLSATSGMQFDREYMQAMVEAHTATVNTFQDEISNGSDADVQAFARKHLPTIQHHLDMARRIAAQY